MILLHKKHIIIKPFKVKNADACAHLVSDIKTVLQPGGVFDYIYISDGRPL